ncbi:MAG: hypothetical protein HUJ30_00655, partial [Gammaproteobacteria bacterium]|nr:hypothetical protein [Gammaproteobacteria bacterium]
MFRSVSSKDIPNFGNGQGDMSINNHTNFLSRIKFIIGGRDNYPWGMALGFGKSTIGAMVNEGKAPSGPTLSNIARAENASLTWLLEGKGQPFLVNHYDRYEDALDYLSAMLEEEAWQPYMITDGARYAMVLTLPGQFESKGKMIDYTLLEVVAGHGITSHAMGIAEYFREASPSLQSITTTAATMDDLYRGRMGTWSLVNAPNALLKRAETLPQWTAV